MMQIPKSPIAVLSNYLIFVLLIAGCTTKSNLISTDAISNRFSNTKTGETIQYVVLEEELLHIWDQINSAAALEEYALAVELAIGASAKYPNNPMLWSKLAELRYAQGEWEDAEALAWKSTAVADFNKGIWYRNLLLIGASRYSRGDIKGAERAKQEATRLLDY